MSNPRIKPPVAPVIMNFNGDTSGSVDTANNALVAKVAVAFVLFSNKVFTSVDVYGILSRISRAVFKKFSGNKKTPQA